jgi:hypothetical protein
LEKSKIGGDIMNNVEMTPVSSSDVAELGYDEPNQVVYVRFLDDGLYIYKGVPQYEYERLLYASSIGSYLYRNIKNVYPYERIE